MSRARPNRPSGKRRAKTCRSASRPRWTTLALKSGRRWRKRARARASGASRRAAESSAEAELAHVPVFHARSQDATGEVAAVGRIREGLRLEAEAGVRAIAHAIAP